MYYVYIQYVCKYINTYIYYILYILHTVEYEN